jgi:hypothetical protein
MLKIKKLKSLLRYLKMSLLWWVYRVAVSYLILDYRLDLQEVQDVRCDKGGTERAENYIYIYIYIYIYMSVNWPPHGTLTITRGIFKNLNKVFNF